MINAIDHEFTEREQLLMNGHTIGTQVHSYSNYSIIKLDRECFKRPLDDCDFAALNPNAPVIVPENAIEEGTGYCSVDECPYVNLSCLKCANFVTTVANRPAFCALKLHLQDPKNQMPSTERQELIRLCDEYIRLIDISGRKIC